MSTGSYLESHLGISADQLIEMPPESRAERVRAWARDLHAFVEDGRSLEQRSLPPAIRERVLSLLAAVRKVLEEAERAPARSASKAPADSPARALATLDARFLTDEFLRGEYTKDQNVYLGGFFTRRLTQAMPDLVFQPVSTLEVSAAMSWARRERVPVTLRGAGTTAMGGSVPAEGGLVLDLTRLDSIEIDPSRELVVIGAGARFRVVHEKLAEAGLALRVYTSNLGGTFAGWLATGGIGLNAFGMGRAKDSVRWIEVVLPDGSMVRLSRTPSENEGLGIDDFAGTEGQFGVVTCLAVETMPRTDHACFLLAFDDVASSFACADWVRKWGGTGFPLPANVKWLSASHLHHARRAWADDDARFWRRAPSGLSSGAGMPWRRLVGPRECGIDDSGAPAGSEASRSPAPAAYLFVDFFGMRAGTAFARALPRAPGPPRVLAEESVRFGAERFRPQSVKRLGPGLVAAEILLPGAHVPEFLRAAARHAMGAGSQLDSEVYYLADGSALALAGTLMDHRRRSFLLDLVLAPVLADLALERFGGKPYVLGRWQGGFFERTLGRERARRLHERKRRLDPEWLLGRGSFFSSGYRGTLGALVASSFAPGIRLARLFYGLPLLHPLLAGVRGALGGFSGPLAGRGANAAEAPPGPDGAFAPREAALRAGTCVNCGECNTVCPVFRDSSVRLPQMLTHLGEAVAAGGEPGPTGSVLLDLCMRCGNCEEVCQAGIPHLPLYEAMQQASDQARPRPRERHLAILFALRASASYARQFLHIRPGGYRKRTPASLPGLLRYVVQRAEAENGPASSCIHCGACVPVCPTNANLEYQESDARLITTVQTRCIGCGTCVEVCPANHANGGQTLRVLEAPTLEWIRLAREAMGSSPQVEARPEPTEEARL